MASAKQCDRCGAYYPRPTCNRAVVVVVDRHPFGADVVDLCDKCTEELCAFIHVDEKGQRIDDNK